MFSTIFHQLNATNTKKQSEVEDLHKQLSEARETAESQQRQTEQQIASLQLQCTKVRERAREVGMISVHTDTLVGSIQIRRRGGVRLYTERVEGYSHVTTKTR